MADERGRAVPLSLVFRAGGRLCALGVEHVVEIMRPLPVTPLAGVPPFVRGVCVIRGAPVAVVGVAGLIGGTGTPPTRFVTLRDGRHPLALAVDAVLGIREIAADTLRECPPVLGEAGPDPVAALGAAGGEALLFLRSARIVPEPVWAAIGRGLAA